MPKTIRFLVTLAASALGLIAISPRAHAQLETFETLSSYNGQGIIGFTNGNIALAQTFTNILELQSITFRITNTGADSVNQNFSAYLVQWNTASGQAAPLSTFTAPVVAGNAGSDVTSPEPSTPFTTFTVPPLGGGVQG